MRHTHETIHEMIRKTTRDDTTDKIEYETKKYKNLAHSSPSSK